MALDILIGKNFFVEKISSRSPEKTGSLAKRPNARSFLVGLS